MTLFSAAGMSGGSTGNGFHCKLQIRAVSKLGRCETGPYRMGAANTSCQGLVATICKLRESVVERDVSATWVWEANYRTMMKCYGSR